MRSHTIASLLLALLLAGISVPAFAQTTMPAPVMASLQSQPHSLIGNWSVSTTGRSAGEPARTGIYSFHEDGTILVIFQARANGTSTAEPMWWGEGIWESFGDAAALYTMSWSTRDDLGMIDGTVTYDGVLTIHSDGVTFEDDRQRSMVTVRDERGLLIATYGGEASDQTAAVTGHRIQVGSR